MVLKEIITIRGQIKLKTGLHIGGSKDDIEIGGIDMPVIKHPNGEPYIPGSSLKGKMRSLTEWLEQKIQPDGKVHTCSQKDCPVCRIFGTTEQDWRFGPTRLIVRDAFLNEDWKRGIDGGLSLTEEKVENWINRLEGKAGGGGLRTTERVPAGAVFDFEMSYKIMEIDGDSRTDRDFFDKVLVALRLVQMDALGGSGSRGYGRISFENLTKTEGGHETSLSLPEPQAIFGRAA
ncbi:MAG: type III-A CRISPR-associated RAMP protein Csm3 [Deltaproteobacteria bacterium]|nr:type III-A CRISPR-associated RAMP protein Csm3 [Deltaproteobacteria bacterium]MBW2066681.1 type III-A CRISPR-associated RAMP protein Csm3 [Deltaproteobacteria bacterium]